MQERLNRWLAGLHPLFRRVLVFVIGMTLLFVGIVMLVLPGPGILVILIALALLATEFAWANSLLQRAKHHASRAANKLSRSR
ncbi:MAG: hypothetical protein E6H93_14970 [Chloroflexi bacterium]|nr:MAG: hypothetical protein E6H93_14970 [Chloroflexota bacterium]